MRQEHMGLVVILLVMITASVPLAEAAPSNYSVNVTNGSISLSISMDFFQNLTLFEKTFSLPEIHTVAEGTNSSSPAQAIQSAIRQRTSQALVDSLRMEADSTVWTNTTSLQWFNVSMQMNISGVSASKGSAVYVDLSWKSFAVSSDIPLGGVEVNNVGKNLLLTLASRLAARTSGNPLITFAYFVEGRELSASQFPEEVSRFFIFNFTRLSSPLATWKETHDPLTQSTSWTLDPAKAQGIMFVERTPEEQGRTEVDYVMQSTISANILATGSFSVNGDTIALRSNNVPETVMSVAIVSMFAIVLVATLYEKRLKAPTERKRKR